MNDEIYHNDTSRISKSGLDLINQTPAHYYRAYFGGMKTDSRTFLFGRAFHARILEPELYFERYHNLLSGVERVQIKNMRKSILTHPSARYLIEGGRNEQVFLWEDEITGAPCKAKADKIKDDVIIDLKSCKDASALGFARSCRNYRYDVQSAFYLDGIPSAKHFVFIAVEPITGRCEVYKAPDRMVNEGRQKYLENLETYMECKKSGVWPAYKSDKIQSVAW
jgi:exodeoxyribonuclease VIII